MYNAGLRCSITISQLGLATFDLRPTLRLQFLVLFSVQPVEDVASPVFERVPALLYQIAFGLLESDACGNPTDE
jgi:hypothetical protein